LNTDDPLPLLFALKQFDNAIIVQSLIILVLLVVSSLIAAAEIAFFSLTPSEVLALEQDDHPTSKKVVKMLADPKRFLATVLLGLNLVNIVVIILFATMIDIVFEFDADQEYLRILIDAGAVTFLLLLVTEVVPKVYATRNALKVVNTMVVPIQALTSILRPLSWVLLSTTSVFEKRFRRTYEKITVDELGHALELTFKNETSEEEKRILEGIVRFGNTSVSQIMKPRMDVIAVDESTNFKELIPVIIDSGYSRIPVYKETIDKIIGILVVKDLLPHMDEPAGFEWQKFIRPSFYVPGNKKIDDLLSDFRHEKVHLAVVVDEYGGTLGIITLEDVLEEIVGDITDEFDDEDITYTKIDDHNYVFEGKTHLVDIYKVLKIDGDDFEKSRGEADTLAGFLLEISGRLMQKSEKITFENYLFTVEAADKKRIKQVKITINDKEENGNGNLLKKTLVLIPLVMLMVSCGGDEGGIPRPRGYFRIELPAATYDSVQTTQPFTFIKNKQALFQEKSSNPQDKNFTVLTYPKLKATIYLTYLTVNDTNLAYLINDCHALVYDHAVKADDIVPDRVDYNTNKVHGLVYDIKGNAATPLQFYVTDSTRHFLRGSLYFYARPNYDSILPVLKYIRHDLDTGLSTLKWK